MNFTHDFIDIPFLFLHKNFMKKSILAKEKFNGLNCSQSVFCVFAPDFGVDEKTALKIASGFGGGMARGETCGAVTGAYMTIGLKHGHCENIPEAKANTKALIKQFNELFIEKHGSLICKKLIGYDLSIPEESEKASQEGVFDSICPRLIESACDMLEEKF